MAENTENQGVPSAGGGTGDNAEFDLLSAAPAGTSDISGRLKPASGAGLPKVTLALVGVVLAVGGFVGGIAVGKSNASTSKNTNNAAVGAARSRGGFGGTGGTAGGPGGQAARGGTVTGTVTGVNGTTLTVTDATGKQVTVDTSDQTTVTIGKAGSLADLAAGTQVTVIGTPGGNGTITARSVLSGVSNLGFGGPRGTRAPSPTASSSGGSNG